MKKLIPRLTAAALLVVLLLGLLPAAGAAAPVRAQGGSIDILFNGTARKLGTYNIADYNYVKLRDVAQLLRGTAKEFSVAWNGRAQCIDLASGKSYTPVGGELGALAAEARLAAPSSASVWLDGAPVALEAYTIDSNNYFKLRDLGAVLDFCVDWDGSRVIVDTSRGYGGENAGGAAAYSDEQLLALAQTAVNDMFEMICELDCYGILPYNEDETIPVVLPGCDPDYPWTYYRVPGYTSLTEVWEAIENAWYQEFSRRYDSLEWLGGGTLDNYYEQDGKVYVQDGAKGVGDIWHTIDRLVSRTADVAKFAGRVQMGGSEVEWTDIVEISLVWEDGTWKYGYFSVGSDDSGTHTWADPNCSDEQMLWMAEQAANRMFNWRLSVELGWSFPVDWEHSITYQNWGYSKVLGYATAAEARATMEEEWYRHFSRRYTIEQVMGEGSNFTSGPAYFVDLADGVYMPECQWGGDSLSFTADRIVSRTADEVVVLVQGYSSEDPEEAWRQPVEISLVFEGGVWKYGSYKTLT